MNKDMFLENTPIEEYKLGSETVYVKREDLYGQDPMPPLAKLRGIRIVLKDLSEQNVKTIGVLDTRVSKSGQGVAAVRNFYYPNMSLVLGYPITRSDYSTPIQHQKAASLGAFLSPQQATRQSIMYYKFRHIVEDLGGVMLPHGLPFKETAKSVAEEIKTVPKELLTGTIVLIVGTGTILAGILIGLAEEKDINIVGISAGKSTNVQVNNINRIVSEVMPFCGNVTGRVKLLNPIMDYSIADTYSCPFPSHPNYDRKAWHWMSEHIDELKKPILFWNIGA